MKYCCKRFNDQRGDFEGIFWDNSEWWVGSVWEKYFSITHCPFCGKELKSETEDK